MTLLYILVTIIASLCSGILATIISYCFHKRAEKRREKYSTLKRFLSNRFDLQGDEFSRAINEIFLVFKSSKKVMNALIEHHSITKEGRMSEDALIKLMKSMFDDLDIDYKDFNDSFFMQPYNTKPWCSE